MATVHDDLLAARGPQSLETLCQQLVQTQRGFPVQPAPEDALSVRTALLGMETCA